MEEITMVLNNPDRIDNPESSASIYSKLVYDGEKYYLYRVFVNREKIPNLIITGYKTSKIKKYGYPLR
jgi:hypothetical protein